MTFDASRPRRSGPMEVMGRRIVFARGMALEADAISWRAQLEAVRLMAIAAGHPGMKHSALDKGAVLVNLAFDLPVGKVEIIVQQ